MKRGVALLLAAVVLCAGVASANYLSQWLRPQPSLPILDSLGGDFSLPSTLGGTTGLSEFSGKVVLLNFGFTSCPDVCPTVLARLRHLLNHPQLRGQPVQALFVTVDPRRDTVDVLRPYLAYFHRDLIGMSGTSEQVQQVSELFKVYSEIQPLDSELGYTVSHSDHIYLLDQQGRVRGTFGNNIAVDRMASVVQRLLDEG